MRIHISGATAAFSMPSGEEEASQQKLDGARNEVLGALERLLPLLLAPPATGGSRAVSESRKALARDFVAFVPSMALKRVWREMLERSEVSCQNTREGADEEELSLFGH